ncbi:hypothetical protein CASFOL_018929 [Castilleja foliolosa]|uniref:Uncharacterized protein n=1 Tax=Castilleja foliolosa TaxID=1961234 RepID=A0ABD3D2Y2_9LAMI
MDDNQRRSPNSSSSTAAYGKQSSRRRLRRHKEDEDTGDRTVACTGKSCQSCTAGVIADCVAMCCCPCAVVNILMLAFVKLPWAVARRCLDGRRKSNRRRRLEERRKCCGDGDRDGISGKGGAEGGITSDIVLSGAVIGDELNDHFSAEFRTEDVWLELYDFGHLGFGRVSFTGISYQDRGT